MCIASELNYRVILGEDDDDDNRWRTMVGKNSDNVTILKVKMKLGKTVGVATTMKRTRK